MRILIQPANSIQLDTYLEIQRALLENGIKNEMLAVTLEKWYQLGLQKKLDSCKIPFHEISRPSGSDQSIWRAKDSLREVREAFAMVETEFQDILKIFSPDLFLICTDHGYFEFSFLRSCKRFKVPSIFVQEGPMPIRWILTPPPRLLIIRLKQKFHKTFQMLKRNAVNLPMIAPFGMNGASMIASIGPDSYNLYRKLGVPKNRISITGQPRMDILWRKIQTCSKGYALIPKKKKARVLYVSSGLSHFGKEADGRRLFADVINAARILKSDVEMFIRLKHGERMNYYTDNYHEIKEIIQFVDSNEPLYEQLKKVDIVIGNNTTAILECGMMGIPGIQLMKSADDDPREYVREKVVLPAKDGVSLSEAIVSLLSTSDIRTKLLNRWEEYYYQRYYMFDGKASKRVANLILKIANLSMCL